MITYTVEQEGYSGKGNAVKADLIIRGFVEDFASFAEDSFIKHVPYASGRTLNAIHKGKVEKTPFGYQAEVGVKSIFGLREGESPDYPLFVHEGTGLWADGGTGSAITPLNGNVIAFEKLGEGTVFTRWVSGQAPQPYLEDVEEEVSEYIFKKKRELAAILSKLV